MIAVIEFIKLLLAARPELEELVRAILHTWQPKDGDIDIENLIREIQTDGHKVVDDAVDAVIEKEWNT